MFLPALAGGDSADDLGVVSDGLLRVEGAFFAGEALHQHAGVFVHQDAHAVAFTTFSAASRMPSATVKFNPESSRILRPSSTLVPSMRTTIGMETFNSRAAATTPVASVSQRRMPPKILINTAFTAWSESRMRKAFLTCSALAPPPTSKKFAGLPPEYLTMSIVAMARPAPLTMQATLPSSLM